jgi:hypothetical protein
MVPTATTAEEQPDSGGLIAVFAGVVVVILACVALGCLMRRGYPGRGRSTVSEHSARSAEVEASVTERDAQLDTSEEDPKASVPELDAETADKDGLLPSMNFWFMPVDQFMRMPVDKPLPRHQELRDMGLLVKQEMTVDDVLSGRFAADTAAVSHRWLIPDHFDPECAKVTKLQEILTATPAIKFLWIDWVCAPQWHGGGRTDEEEEEFRLILENILPFIFLGCTVIVLYERIYNQRFWPNVECWISTKMPTEDGLMPASEERLRMQVYGIESQSGKDDISRAYVLEMWHAADAQQAIHDLAKNDILVTNARDKEVNLKVVGSLDEKIKRHHVLHI